VEYRDYIALKQRIVPQLRFNQAIYEDVVTEHVTEQTVWLDAGCGHHIFPVWREEAEHRLVNKADLVIGCDLDHLSLRRHRTLDRLVVADLTALPFKAGSVSLITCNMVVEHLDQPLEVFAEFARTLKSGGRIIVHTPHVYSHFVMGSRFVPRRFKLRLVKALDGRLEVDVFRTRYRANAPIKLRGLMASVGLRQETCRMLASDAILAMAHPFLTALELLYIRVTLRPTFKFLRVSILATFVKTTGKT
jgi:SAM-dependent methyltransferase